MRKRSFMLFILSVILLLLSGCATIKGAWKGATEGAKEDWEDAQKIDEWMRENLW